MRLRRFTRKDGTLDFSKATTLDMLILINRHIRKLEAYLTFHELAERFLPGYIPVPDDRLAWVEKSIAYWRPKLLAPDLIV